MMHEVYRAMENCFKSLFEYILLNRDKDMAGKVLKLSKKMTEYMEHLILKLNEKGDKDGF